MWLGLCRERREKEASVMSEEYGVIPEWKIVNALKECLRDKDNRSYLCDAPPGAKSYIVLMFYFQMFFGDCTDELFNQWMLEIACDLQKDDIRYLCSKRAQPPEIKEWLLSLMEDNVYAVVERRDGLCGKTIRRVLLEKGFSAQKDNVGTCNTPKSGERSQGADSSAFSQVHQTYCSTCGHVIEPTARFCAGCGQPTNEGGILLLMGLQQMVMRSLTKLCR